MLIIKKKLIYSLLFVLFFTAGFGVAQYFYHPRVKIGGYNILCNPKAKINPKKNYNLSLWDYQWPVGDDKAGYREYLDQAIADFQKIYPNIRVKVTLLDLLEDSERLNQTLKNGMAPDLYCSAFETPAFNFRWQVPVGPYLNSKEKKEYFTEFLKPVELDGVICSFPRWSSWGIWIGNRSLMEKAGFSIAKIQNAGWTWEEYLSGCRNMGSGNFGLVGNPGQSGFFLQLLANSGNFDPIKGLQWNTPEIGKTLNLLGELVKGKMISRDFDSNALGQFLSGRALVIAGIHPIIDNFLKSRLRDRVITWDPVFLPVPSHIPQQRVLLVENGVICVYRNKKTAGDGQITSAIRLAQFLSLYQEVRPWKELRFFPAGKIAAARWLQELSAEEAMFWQRTVEKAIVCNLEKKAGDQEQIFPVLREFCTGKITKEEAESRLSNYAR